MTAGYSTLVLSCRKRVRRSAMLRSYSDILISVAAPLLSHGRIVAAQAVYGNRYNSIHTGPWYTMLTILISERKMSLLLCTTYRDGAHAGSFERQEAVSIVFCRCRFIHRHAQCLRRQHALHDDRTGKIPAAIARRHCRNRMKLTCQLLGGDVICVPAVRLYTLSAWMSGELTHHHRPHRALHTTLCSRVLLTDLREAGARSSGCRSHDDFTKHSRLVFAPAAVLTDMTDIPPTARPSHDAHMYADSP